MADNSTSNRFFEDEHNDFKVIFEVASVGIVQVHARDGRFIRANEKYCQITGYTEEELKSMCFSELTHPDDRQKDWELFSQAVRGELPSYINEKRYVRKDGSIIWVRLNAMYIRDNDGTPVRTVAVCEDITDRKQNEWAIRESEDRFRILADGSPVMIFVHDKSGKLQFINAAYSQFFGLTVEDVGGEGWENLVHPEDEKDYVERFFSAIKDQVSYNTQARVKRNDGEWRWVESHVQPRFTLSGEFSGMVGAAVDITEQKKAEEKLQISEANHRLLAQQLEEANHRKDEFLGALSHEIRNPMASITLGLSLLERSFFDEAKAKQAMSIMKRQLSQLSRLVDDLLDVTRITRNLILLKKKQVDLNALIFSTLEDYRVMLQDKEIELALKLAPAPLYVEADPTRLVQILENLLHNAVKFTKPGGGIQVTLSVDTSGQLAVVCIEDNGIGMDKKTIENLFTPFLQADSSLDRSNGGLGLGLALVKGLMELHGGIVKAYSDGLGKGSKFTLCLPLTKEYKPELGEKSVPCKSLYRHRVLLIEDIKDVADIIKLLLEEEGHDVKVAYTGIDGISLAKDYRPDVILCDIGLPGMDGYQVARALRSDRELQNVFLISLTGYARTEDTKRSKDAGFHYQLIKPVGLEELRQALTQVKVNHGNNQTA